MRALRRFTAAAIIAALLLEAPREAVAQTVASGLASAARPSGNGALAAGRVAATAPLGVLSIPRFDLGLRPATVPPAQPSAAAPEAARSLPRSAKAVLTAKAARANAPRARAHAPAVAKIKDALENRGAPLEEMRAAAAKDFEGAPAEASVLGVRVDRAPAARPAFLGRWTASAGRTASKLYRAIDLSRDEGADAEPAAPPAAPSGRLVTVLRAGAAGVALLGLGVGFVFSGAAIAASGPIWNPLFATVAAALGLGSVGLAVERRLAASSAARAPSALPAVLGGAGLLLLGAAAAPLLGALAGLPALRLGAVGLMVALALGFEFLNGMHDAANSIATVVTTKTLSPRQAVLWAAFFNSSAYFVFGAHIAAAIGSGLVIPSLMSNALLVAALLGASLWNWLTIRLGIPVSSSHSLIGGLVGAAVVAGGFAALLPGTLIKTAAFMVLSPIIGLLVSFALMAVIDHFFDGPLSQTANKAFGGCQLLSSALLSLGHGGNDSQKTIGIITALMFANGLLGAQFHVPWFVAVASYLAMGLGTMAGGWRIIKTMGEKVTTLDRPMGTAAEVGAGAAIMLSTWLGIPVSTTHVVTGSVAGVGAAHGGSASVKWGTLAKIGWAWVLTIPLSALASALLYWLFMLMLG